MLKKFMLLAVAIAALAAFAIPATASAFWKDNGTPITENKTLHFTGTYSFTGGLGGFSCPETTMTLLATAGTTDGHIAAGTGFHVDTPSGCDISGLLGASCGTHSLTAVTLTSAATATDETTKVKISNIDLDNTFGTCTSLTFSGSITATPDSTSAIHDVTLSGTLTSAAGNVTVSGTLTTTPAEEGTYGL